MKVISDDEAEIALIDVSTIDEAQMILVNLYHSQTKFMKLGGFDGSKGWLTFTFYVLWLNLLKNEAERQSKDTCV